ncbi:MAG: hypothetical protein AAGA56_08880, partial [Myxococcota bacterium]
LKSFVEEVLSGDAEDFEDLSPQKLASLESLAFRANCSDEAEPMLRFLRALVDAGVRLPRHMRPATKKKKPIAPPKTKTKSERNAAKRRRRKKGR